MEILAILLSQVKGLLERRANLYMSQDGSIWQLFVLCLLALGELAFTIVWDTPGKEKVAKWSSAPASILEVFN